MNRYAKKLWLTKATAKHTARKEEPPKEAPGNAGRGQTTGCPAPTEAPAP